MGFGESTVWSVMSPGGPPPFVVDVFGTPAPQGSKKGFALKKGGQFTGKVAQVESSNKIKPWREAVKHAALNTLATHGTAFGALPVAVIVDFYLSRPKGHYGTGRNAGVIKASAPARPAVAPDVDKTVRGVLDALTDAGVYKSDAQVVDLAAGKWYADARAPGARIVVRVAG